MYKSFGKTSPLYEMATELLDENNSSSENKQSIEIDNLNPNSGGRGRKTSAAKAVVATTLFSQPQSIIPNDDDSDQSDSQDDKFDKDLKSKSSGFIDKNKPLIKNIFKIIFIIFILAYSIAAFVLDFDRAFGLFIAEIIIISILTLRFLYNKLCLDSNRNNRFCSLETIIQGIQQNRCLLYSIYVLLTCIVITIIILCNYHEPERLISAVGLCLLILFCWLFSWNRGGIKWRPVIWGFGLQFTLGLFILRTQAGFDLFEFLGEAFKNLLDFTFVGTEFVFDYLAVGITLDSGEEIMGVFAFSVIPTVIFFSSIVSVLYYAGIIQVIIYYISVTMSYTLGTSSSESLNAAGNIFVGMTEAPLLIKPFVKTMTRSELHAVMTGGFATIAGGVLAIYISFGVSASHLLTASVMSAPAALAISKIVYPEDSISPTAQTKERRATLLDIGHGTETNIIEAAANGASLAIGLAANIVGMLISFLSLIALLDNIFKYFGSLIGWDTSFTILCGYVFYPLSLAMGIRPKDCLIAGQLIGRKIFINEFVAYTELLEVQDELSDRSIVVLIYALCGFSNFGSIGITLGGLTPLAPNRSKDLTQLVLSAMISGNVACFMTACIAALLYNR